MRGVLQRLTPGRRRLSSWLAALLATGVVYAGRHATTLNSFLHRRAFLTIKRSLENDLHPDTVYEANGVKLRIGDDTPVAEPKAKQVLEARRIGPTVR